MATLSAEALDALLAAPRFAVLYRSAPRAPWRRIASTASREEADALIADVALPGEYRVLETTHDHGRDTSQHVIPTEITSNTV